MTPPDTAAAAADVLRDGPGLDEAETHARLEKTWETPPGFLGWLAAGEALNTPAQGRRYCVQPDFLPAHATNVAHVVHAQQAAKRGVIEFCPPKELADRRELFGTAQTKRMAGR